MDVTLSDAPTADEAELALVGMLEAEPDALAGLAQAAAVLWATLTRINWAGFYLKRGSDLVLGPFQGKPACTRIAMGTGVCGSAAARQETLVVEDVLAFPTHIACDSASRSEIVVPLLHDGQTVGVIDVDSPVLARFGDGDRALLERLAPLLAPLAAKLTENVAGSR